jgi:hypothetical protein
VTHRTSDYSLVAMPVSVPEIWRLEVSGSILYRFRHSCSGGSRVSIWGGANLKLAGDFHGERGSASLYGGLGAVPPVGSRGKAPGQGVRGLRPLKLKPFTQLLLQFLVEIRLYFLKS